MSGPSLAEFLILCLIGLIVLGPKRLPEVASQLGKWVGQARRMTRVLRRQLEEELDVEKQLELEPTIHSTPRDDDTYSPLHTKPPDTIAGIKVRGEGGDDETDTDEEHDDSDLDVDPDDEQDSEQQKEA
ncbi:MAG: twin-arginine translocase TatA/TatE family subunit [Woeseiaceae bacterium]